MSDKLLMIFIDKANTRLAEMAKGAMEYPKSDPFEHGIQVGYFRGVQEALNILENIMNDDYEQRK